MNDINTTTTPLSKQITNGLYADRDTIDDALTYAYASLGKSFAAMTPLFVVLNTVAKEVAKLEQQNADLEKRNIKLEQRIAELEKQQHAKLEQQNAELEQQQQRIAELEKHIANSVSDYSDLKLFAVVNQERANAVTPKRIKRIEAALDIACHHISEHMMPFADDSVAALNVLAKAHKALNKIAAAAE